METYLIFFGKSQDFSFEVFDKNGYIIDFNNIIRDFDLLESMYFMTDDLSNKEILAKYNFISKTGKKYSLLKIYSLAQAVNGNRISGSTYGVAILSDKDVLITNFNLTLLNQAKENFRNLSLSGLKFNKSNFKEDVYKIWRAIVTASNNNYFDQIALGNEIKISDNKNPRSYFVKSIFEESLGMESENAYSQKLYFSNDIEHLKRINLKWGANFPIFVKSENKWIPYTEFLKISAKKYENIQKIESVKNSQYLEKSNSNLISEINDLKYEKEQLIVEAKKKINKLEVQNKIYFYIICFQLILVFFISAYFILKKNSQQDSSDIIVGVDADSLAYSYRINLEIDNDKLVDIINDKMKFELFTNAITNYQKLLNINITKNEKTDSLTMYQEYNLLFNNFKKLGLDTTKIEAIFKNKMDEFNNIRDSK